jgi:rhomboid protease GluP
VTMRSRLSRAPFTASLLALIAIVMLFEWKLGAIFVEWGPHTLASDNELLYRMGALTGGVFATGEYWRLVSAMFLHANLAHWGANSFTLYQLGTLYEELFGSARLALIYTITGVCASIVSAMRLAPDNIAVGASGAILGILGAFFFSIRRSPLYRNERWTRSLLVQLAFWAILNIIIGLSVPQIDNSAHLGGLISGLILGALLPHRVPPPPPSRTVIEVRPDGQ